MLEDDIASVLGLELVDQELELRLERATEFGADAFREVPDLLLERPPCLLAGLVEELDVRLAVLPLVGRDRVLA